MTRRWPLVPGRWAFPVAAALYAAVASLSRPLTGTATVAVAIPVLVVLFHAGRSRAGAQVHAVWTADGAGRPRTADAGRPRSARDADEERPRIVRTAVVWGAVVVLAVGWEVAALLHQPAYNVGSYDHPTISLLLDPVTGSGPTRFVVWCLWLYLGYRLVRR